MIACLGECLIDFTPILEDGRTTGFAVHPGGSPYNVAVAIARLGHASAFAGRISTDFFGRILLDRLRAEGVDVSRVRRGDEPTTLAFVALEDGEPSFSFRSEGAAETLLRPGDLDPSEFRGLDALHVGSISLLYEPTGTSIVELVRALTGRVTVSFDPNVRPALIADAPAYRARVRALLATSDLVKLSEPDRRELGDIDPAGLLHAESGPAALVVTDGVNGSRLFRRGSTIAVPALRSRVVDAVGAGDAFTAGVLVGLAERGALTRDALRALDLQAWRDVLAFASVTAALTCERSGAEPPTRSEVEARLASAWARAET
jgi:fructokinase